MTVSLILGISLSAVAQVQIPESTRFETRGDGGDRLTEDSQSSSRLPQSECAELRKELEEVRTQVRDLRVQFDVMSIQIGELVVADAMELRRLTRLEDSGRHDTAAIRAALEGMNRTINAPGQGC